MNARTLRSDSSNKQTLFTCAIVLGMLGAVAGCSSYKSPTIQASSARVVEIAPKSAAPQLEQASEMGAGAMDGSANVGTSPVVDQGGGVAMEFYIDVENSNDEGLPLRAVNYVVEIEGKRVFSATRSAEATASRTSTQRVRLPASFRAADVGIDPFGIKPYRVHGSMTYVTPGAFAEALFDSGVRVPSVAFSVTGEIDFAAAAGTPAAR